MDKKIDDNCILIGGKPFMNYVTGVLVQFNKGATEVVIKSRGKFISKAVDVVEVTKRKFLTEPKIEIKDIKIDSEEFEREDKKKVCVSSLEIVLAKK